MKRVFTIADKKPVFAQWFVEIDLTPFLNGETITAIVFSATDSAGADATDTILDSTKNTYTTTMVKPFIRGGVPGEKYKVKMQITTASAAQTKDEFYLLVTVGDY